MFLTRKIGSFLRGKATRTQVFLAALLGGTLGFVPGFVLPDDLGGGFAQAPGLILGMLFLVLVLNANLGVFAMTALVAKLCSLLLLPASFAIGRALIDGPMQPVFRSLANGPVTAWFGFEYYATTGGLVLGLFFGAAAGWLLTRALTAFRHRMATVATTSEKYQKHSGKVWSRLLAWVLFGSGKGKKLSYQDLLDAERGGRPVRLAGLVLVVLISGGLFVFQGWFSRPLLTNGLQSGLTAANGATVDVESAELLLGAGTVRIAGLAITDAGALDTNVFEAAGLEADIDVEALLRRRFVVDRLRATGARTGGKRAEPGELVEAEPEPEPPVEAGEKTLEDYLEQAEVWKDRIVQLKEWLDYFGGGSAEPPAETPAEQREQQRRDIEQQVEEYGLARVVATHLREQYPLIWIRSVDIEDVAAAQLPDERLDLRGKNLSSDAWLLPTPPELSVTSATSDKLRFAFTGPSKDRKGAALEFTLRRVPIDSVMGMLKLDGSPPLQGGTLDLSTDGSITTHGQEETTVQLPFRVDLHDTTFSAFGAKPTQIDALALPFGVRGRVDNPVVSFDNQALVDALVASGKQELARFVQGEAQKLLEGVDLPAVPGIGEVLDPNKTPQENVDAARQELERQKAEAEAKAEAEKQRLLEEAGKKAAEEAKKNLPGGLRGILPGGGGG